MSETEYHRGKLRKVLRSKEESLEKQCEKICLLNSYKFDQRYHNSWKECLQDEGYSEFIIVKGIIFQIYDHYKDDEAPFIVEQNPDGTYSFHGSFYNGGACLNEMLEEGLL